MKITIELPEKHTASYAYAVFKKFNEFKTVREVGLRYGQWRVEIPAGTDGESIATVLSAIPKDTVCKHDYSFYLQYEMEWKYGDGEVSAVSSSQN